MRLPPTPAPRPGEPMRPLSKTEVLVALHLARGREPEGTPYREIGAQLGMAKETVRVHVNAIARAIPKLDWQIRHGGGAKQCAFYWSCSNAGQNYLYSNAVWERTKLGDDPRVATLSGSTQSAYTLPPPQARAG